MTVTDQQARAITFLAMAARPTGAPRWDEAGIFAAVMKVRDRSVAAVTIAVIQAAEDRKAQTPGVIPKPGPHWRDPATTPAPERPGFDAADVCAVCSERRASCELRWAGHPDGHEFVSVAARRALAPGSIEAAKAALESLTLCVHKVTPDACGACRLETTTRRTAHDTPAQPAAPSPAQPVPDTQKD